ncbi:MAG: MFS transporter [Pseudomonadota bacterium]
MRTNWTQILALWLAGLGAAAQYGKISVIFDRLGAVYPDAGVALGLVVSLVGFVGILLGVVAALLVARLRYRRTLVWALVAGGVISLYQATLPALPWMLASRVLEGMSHLAIVVAAPTMIAAVSADADRGLALTLWGTFFGVAITALVWLGLPFVDWLGLPALFVAHGVYMLAFAVILSRILPRIEAPVEDVALTPRAILRRHGAIYRSPYVSAPAFGWLFYTLSYVSILTLLPPFLEPGLRAIVIGAMPLISIVSSLLLGVWLLRRMAAVSVMQVGFVASAICAVGLAVMPGNPAVALALAAALGLVQGAGFAAVPQLNETTELRAQANGALAQAGNVGNTLGTPVLLIMIGIGGHTAFLLSAAAILVLGYVGQVWLARKRAA